MPVGRVTNAVPPSEIGIASTKVPKEPVSNGDTDVDGSDVPAKSVRLPLALTVILRSSTAGGTSTFAVSVMFMTRVEFKVNVPL